jgi:hypothetical protein
MAVAQRGARRRAERRHWADTLAIFTGVALLGLAIWAGANSASVGAAQEPGNLDVLWLVHALAGLTTLAGVTIAEQWKLRSFGRTLMMVAAGGLLVVLFTFDDFGLRALLTVLVPAILLLVAAFVGPTRRRT